MKIERQEIEKEIIVLRGDSKKDKRVAVMLAWLLEQLKSPSEYERLMK